MSKKTNGWYKCRTAIVISNENKVLLDILNADKYKVENGWLLIKDYYNQIHHFPASSVKKFVAEL